MIAEITITGYSDCFRGWVHDKTWTWILDEPVGRKGRLTFVEESLIAFSLRWGRSVEGGPWELTGVGRATRIQRNGESFA